MAPNIENICLFAGSHAVEVMTFSVIFDLPIDHVDIRKFEDNIQEIEKIYPSIKSPEIIQIAIAPSGQNPPPLPIPIKELNSYLSNGKPEWSGSYGENAISVSCHKYRDGNNPGRRPRGVLTYCWTVSIPKNQFVPLTTK